MVNETAVHKIIKFIESQNISQMKKWSERSRYNNRTMQLLRFIREKVVNIREILRILSGNDIVEMLKGCLYAIKKLLFFLFLSPSDVLNAEERDNLTHPKYKLTLANLVILFIYLFLKTKN